MANEQLHSMVDAIIKDDSSTAKDCFHSYVTDKVRAMVSPAPLGIQGSDIDPDLDPDNTDASASAT